MTAESPKSVASGSLDPTASAGKRKARILIVEDNYFVALTIENALMDAGYEVLAVLESGEAALESISDAEPDLVLMDIRLAGELDGIDTALALHRLGIASLFASAHFDQAMKQRGAAAMPAGWLVKPFSEPEIINAVETALFSLNGRRG
ncbi:MAG: response regulator [Alphaproteobacteria bacterium]|nr:response regulator [Alphaproteobacteria bacterium]